MRGKTISIVGDSFADNLAGALRCTLASVATTEVKEHSCSWAALLSAGISAIPCTMLLLQRSENLLSPVNSKTAVYAVIMQMGGSQRIRKTLQACLPDLVSVHDVNADAQPSTHVDPFFFFVYSQSHPFPWGLEDKSYTVKAFNVTVAEAFSPFLADYVCHGVRRATEDM